MSGFERVLEGVLQHGSINTALICRKPQKSCPTPPLPTMWAPPSYYPQMLLSLVDHRTETQQTPNTNAQAWFGNEYTGQCRSRPWEQPFLA